MGWVSPLQEVDPAFADRDLVAIANNILYAAMAQNTHESYASAVRQYVLFCSQNNVHARDRFPPSDKIIVLYIAWLASNRQVKFKTIKAYLSGLSFHCQNEGYDFKPFDQRRLVVLATRGVKRWLGDSVDLVRLPITAAILRAVKAAVNMAEQPYATQLIFTAMVIGTFGLFRSGELVASDSSPVGLLNGDVIEWEGDSKEFYQIHLPHSKTDPFRRGATITIAAPMAVAQIRHFAERLRPNNANTSSPTTPFLCYTDGKPLTKPQLIKGVRTLLTQAKIPDVDKYKGHSFRKGGAQSLKDIGCPDSVIKQLGRWSSESHVLYHSASLRQQLEASTHM